MSVKGFKNYDEEGNFLGVEKYDYGSLENIPKNFKNDSYEQDIKQLKTDVEKNVTDHNVSKDAHNDIRLLITDIIYRYLSLIFTIRYNIITNTNLFSNIHNVHRINTSSYLNITFHIIYPP